MALFLPALCLYMARYTLYGSVANKKAYLLSRGNTLLGNLFNLLIRSAFGVTT